MCGCSTSRCAAAIARRWRRRRARCTLRARVARRRFAMIASRVRTSPPSRSLRSRATSPRLRREEEFRPKREQATPNLIAQRTTPRLIAQRTTPRLIARTAQLLPCGAQRLRGGAERSEAEGTYGRGRRTSRDRTTPRLIARTAQLLPCGAQRLRGGAERSEAEGTYGRGRRTSQAARRRGRANSDGELRAIEPRRS